MIKPHDQARIEIDSWRGRCLNIFARGEKVIGQTLEAIRRAAKEPETIRLRHLAGQRAEDLARQLASQEVATKQSKAAQDALAAWREHEKRRVSLAHAIMSVTIDSRGKWLAVFDLTVYRSGQPQFERWAVMEAEAGDIKNELEASWKKLSEQLGQVRKKHGT